MPNRPPISFTLSLMRPRRPDIAPRPEENGAEPQPLDPLRGTPYTVYRLPSVKGSVLLIGYDGHGDAMLEFRIPERLYTHALVKKMERTLRDYDPGPHLAIT